MEKERFSLAVQQEGVAKIPAEEDLENASNEQCFDV